MLEALRKVARGAARHLPRQVTPVTDDAQLGFMPAGLPGLLGYKVVGVFPRNQERGLNPHQGLVTLVNPETGRVTALLEGSTLTALRTAAVSAAATELLSREDAKTLVLIGSGRQAREHERALRRVRDFREIRYWNRSTEHSPRAAVADADVVVSVTPSREILFGISDLKPGAHLNAVGASRPGFRELDLSDGAATLYADCREACLLESDELHGLSFTELGASSGRASASEITVFKSVGLGIEDLAAAAFFVERARALGLGQEVEF